MSEYMNQSPEEIANQIFNTLNCKYKANNSSFWFNRFVEAVEKNDNKAIESSKVYELLEYMLSNKTTHFKERVSAGVSLYRGRIIDIKETQKLSANGDLLHGLDKFDSKEPPLHTSKDGRSNIAGASYLYLSKDKYTAVSECKPLRDSFLSVAEFETDRELNIFNMCDNDSLEELKDFQTDKDYLVKYLVEYVIRAFYNSVYDINCGYRVTQYITELIRKHGYDGIAYKSYISNGKNYTIFNCCESNIKFIKSEIVWVTAQHIDIYDLNSGNSISNPNTLQAPSKEIINDYKKYLTKKINYLNFNDQTEKTEDKSNG